ncbi:hypothetical protein [Nocardia terpenica]|uniref:Uncharacterized protein n=1 Tax=Nocardia terpenica TaxID=455432 RepID=A0A164JG69_9NOCA|nr:hypothetical protein [Nocardia terpenica]ATL69992.1 hypothetical protein CRH09_31220 [Nocardia terpenica]KZM70371.1 hypothetical protein AWN90_03555 [Nocardia terpenica]MBF6063440.1 hypothetical protein [Nocardia terpenica]MBF6105996.1 hypothetical protein [Nocardia terpenica]MBF6113419.1 hypothetical protein [Nocardia terpenica]
MLDTLESATEYVIAELEAKGTATREDFDVHAIVATTRAIAESWDFRSIDRSTFWNIAAAHIRF